MVPTATWVDGSNEDLSDGYNNAMGDGSNKDLDGSNTYVG